MSDEQPPGYVYWSLIEPYWLLLNDSWDEYGERFVARIHKVPPKVGQLYAAPPADPWY